LNEIRAGRTVDLLLEPKTAHATITLLKSKGFQPAVVTDNIQSLIDHENEKQVSKTLFNSRDDPSKFPFDKYNSFESITNYLKAVEAKYGFVKTFKIGTTTEKRDFFGIKISKPSKDGKPKNAVWLDGGIHAREWMSPATIVYVINELTSKYGSDTEITQLVDGLDWFVSPSINPDGYEFSRSSNRLWRKTRSGPRNGCYGVDPNRNWNFKWNVVGTSTNPCSEIYDGPSPFSEVETQVVSNFLLANKDLIKAYVSLHSYSELWMYPWSYAAHTYTDDHQEYVALSTQGVAAIRAVHQIRYTAGTPPDVLYAVGGGSFDWAKAVAGIKWSFTLELRPGDNDPNGFQLPASQIIAAAEEAWAGIILIAKQVFTTA